MRNILLLCVSLLAVAGCTASKKERDTNTARPVNNNIMPLIAPASVQYPEVGVCHSVELFKEVSVSKPDSEIPESQSKFSGRWGNGKWNNVLCQDVHILRVNSDNTADIFDGQGPYEPWGVWAAGYMRKAQFIPAVDDRGDILRVNGNQSVIDYWVKGNTMYGVRQEKNGDQLFIQMARKPN